MMLLLFVFPITATNELSLIRGAALEPSTLTFSSPHFYWVPAHPIYISPCYLEIQMELDVLMNCTVRKSIRSALLPTSVITGNPGIGKTLFVLYLFCETVKQGNQIVVYFRPHVYSYNNNNGSFHIEKFDEGRIAAALLKQNDCLALYDCCNREQIREFERKGPLVICSSPQ